MPILVVVGVVGAVVVGSGGAVVDVGVSVAIVSKTLVM